ncbi:hypothetical protein F511_21028 [Dorcoceras hygrometricum]|uniref:Uncharacterized protein n=1 Tax=Dorcoceras hygrometricum TaxID=472368 RepID=A0A2Z7A9R8_9LAMI|nr:hypothetical protein F511_21028 [Dorcoceras hygrometricum]
MARKQLRLLTKLMAEITRSLPKPYLSANSSRPQTLVQQTQESYGSAKYLRKLTQFHARTAHGLHLKERPAYTLLLSSGHVQIKYQKVEIDTKSSSYLKQSSTQTDSSKIERSCFIRILHSNRHRPPSWYEIRALNRCSYLKAPLLKTSRSSSENQNKRHR